MEKLEKKISCQNVSWKNSDRLKPSMAEEKLFSHQIEIEMKTYYDPEDLKKFGEIKDFQPELGAKFFDYYGDVFKEGALTAREKSLIALAVSHAVQCPYCIEAYTEDSMEKGCDEEQMMEAVHVAAAIKSGATLVHGVQMMNKYKDLSM